jgi:transcriptional regulator with XRE-family HTH domain
MARKKELSEAGLVQKLQAAIQDSGLTLTQLSERAGIALPQLTRFMKGERGLTLASAEKICNALGLDLVKRRRGRLSDN